MSKGAAPSVRRLSSSFLIAFLFTVMLLFPNAVFDGASEGLLLWFQIVFPTLFPFMVVTNLLLASGTIFTIAGIIRRPAARLFGVSANGSFVVLAGFLCGYPMGAKITGDLLRTNLITVEEGRYLLSFCNNTSPVFIMNFIVWKTLGEKELLFPSLAVLMGTPVLLSFIFRRFYLPKGSTVFPEPGRSEKHEERKKDFNLLDSCMMNSFEAIVKVGGYIILFSVILSLLTRMKRTGYVFSGLSAALEVTNGILLIAEAFPSPEAAWPAIMGLTAFGGLCSAAQTRCMVQGTGLKIRDYVIQKLAAAAAASLMAFLYINMIQSV